MDPATEAILSGNPTTVVATPAVESAPVSTDTPISQTTTPEPGKSVTPDPGQVVAQPVATVTPESSAPAESEQAVPVPTDEELLGATGLTESPEQENSRLKRDYAASSKETRRVLKRNEALESILKDQGTDIADDENGVPTGLIANKKYSKEMAGLNIKADELPDDIQANFETDQQKVVDFIVEKAKKALTRVVPTLDKAIKPLSTERHESSMKYLEDMKWENGNVKFPGLAKNRPVIEQMLNSPSVSNALKDFKNQAPEMAFALLNLQIEHARAHIIAVAQKANEEKEAKKKAAEANPQPLPSGGGSATLGGSSQGDLASQVAGVKMRY